MVMNCYKHKIIIRKISLARMDWHMDLEWRKHLVQVNEKSKGKRKVL